MPIDTPPKINTPEKFVPPPLIAGDVASMTAFKEWLHQNLPEMQDDMIGRFESILKAHQGILGPDKTELTDEGVSLFTGALLGKPPANSPELKPIAPKSLAGIATGRTRTIKPSAPASTTTPDTQIDPVVLNTGVSKTLENVDFKEAITAETLAELLLSLDTLVEETKNLRSAAGLSHVQAREQSPSFKVVRSEIIKLRNRLVKQKEGAVVDTNEMMEIKKSLLANLITYKAEIEALKKDPDVPPPPPDNPDAKTPEQLAYETARGLWSRSKMEMTTAEVSRFSPEYAQLKKEIQSFNTKGMPTDVAEKAKLRHIEMKEKVEGIERRYLEAKATYASSLEKVIATSKSPEEKAKLQSLIVARFFAKTGEERYQNSFEDSTKSITERTANRSDYRSYREREISLNEEILSEKKKNLFGKLKGVWDKVPSSLKMGFGGAAIGLAVAGGGWVPVIGAVGASIATRGAVNFTGNRFFGRRQEKKNDQTRLRGIVATRASDFASFESSLEKGDRSLRNIKTATTVTGYVAGAVAAKLTAGALSGVTVDDVRNFVGEKVFDITSGQVDTLPETSEMEIISDSANQALQESINVLREEVIEKLDACINALQNELQDELTSAAPLPDADMVEQPSFTRGASEFVERQPNVGSLSAENFNPDGTFNPNADNSVLTAESVAEVYDLPSHIYPVVEGDPGVSYELKELYPEIFGEYTKDQWVSFIDSVNSNPELLKASGIESGNLGLIYEGNTVRTDLLAEYAIAPEAKTYLDDASLAPETSMRPLARPDDIASSTLAPDESIRPQAKPEGLVPSELAPSESPRPMPRPEFMETVDPAILDSEVQAPKSFEESSSVTPESLYSQKFVMDSYQDILGTSMELPESVQIAQLTELSAWAQEHNVAGKAELDARLDVIIQRDAVTPLLFANNLEVGSDMNFEKITKLFTESNEGGPSLQELVFQKQFADPLNPINHQNSLFGVELVPLLEDVLVRIPEVASLHVGEILERAIERGFIQIVDGQLVQKF